MFSRFERKAGCTVKCQGIVQCFGEDSWIDVAFGDVMQIEIGEGHRIFTGAVAADFDFEGFQRQTF